MSLEARAVRAGATPPLTLLGEGAEGAVFRDARGLAFKVGKHAPPHTLAEEAELLRLLGGTAVAAHVPRFIRYDAMQDVLVREAITGERVGWLAGDSVRHVFERVRAEADRLDYRGIEAKTEDVRQTPDGRVVLLDLGFAFPVRARGVRAVVARLGSSAPFTGEEAFDLAMTIRQLAVEDNAALTLADGLALLATLEARTGRTFDVRRDFESDLGLTKGQTMQTSGLGKTPWVDKALAKVLDRIESEVSPEWAPVPILNAPRGRKSFEEYGCGHYGCVMPTRTPGVVLKVTSDPSEAWFVAHVLRGQQDETEGLVRYFDVRTLPAEERRGRPVYAIWRSEAHEIGRLRRHAHTSSFTVDPKDDALSDGVRRLWTIEAAGRALRARYQRAKSPEEWFAALAEAADYEDQAVRANYDSMGVYDGRLELARGPLRLALALTGFRIYSEQLSQEDGLYRVGDALHTYFERGFVLADVHRNNIGKPLDDDGWNAWIITDPGHAVPLRPDLLRVEIKEL